MIKALIFDCWGTLFTSSLHPHPFEVFARTIGYDIKNRNFLKIFENHIMTNSNPISKNIELLLAELGIKSNQSLVLELVKIINSSLSAQIAYDDTIDTLNNLKTSYRLILLSNTFNEGFTNLRSIYPIDSIFELTILSYEEKTIKPNKELYKTVLNKTQLNSSEVIMIGDNLHDDIIAAQNSNIKAILLDRRNRHPEITENKINNLKNLEKLLYLVQQNV